jgi:crotonobetainyl-CoA:carnitine CoA-transferase CaiB-like acyl-CoA transferase
MATIFTGRRTVPGTLEVIRILDLSTGTAGPIVAVLLAVFGTEV